jgi:hypothetical protein
MDDLAELGFVEEMRRRAESKRAAEQIQETSK